MSAAKPASSSPGPSALLRAGEAVLQPHPEALSGVLFELPPVPPTAGRPEDAVKPPLLLMDPPAAALGLPPVAEALVPPALLPPGSVLPPVVELGTPPLALLPPALTPPVAVPPFPSDRV